MEDSAQNEIIDLDAQTLQLRHRLNGPFDGGCRLQSGAGA
jgi:hypothetical protein